MSTTCTTCAEQYSANTFQCPHCGTKNPAPLFPMAPAVGRLTGKTPEVPEVVVDLANASKLGLVDEHGTIRVVRLILVRGDLSLVTYISIEQADEPRPMLMMRGTMEHRAVERSFRARLWDRADPKDYEQLSAEFWKGRGFPPRRAQR